jgi:crotonobetainyl-CoA:carnitine CoA-transferase CaiB-like acyl-CoA transferase
MSIPLPTRGGHTAALQGLRVLDFSHVYQGPVGTQILADYGADVIKVERPGSGDWSRAWGPFIGDLSLPFANLNRNKRSLAVDMKKPEGRELVRRLLKDADVLVHNFRKGVMEKLGFGYEDLAESHPRLVYAWSSGWGDHGPYADRGRGGHDMMARAEAGWFLHAIPGKPPIPGGISIDYAAGLNLMLAVMMALRHRDASGRGQFVSTDLFSVAFHAHAWDGAVELNADMIDRPAAIGGTEAAIDRAFATADGFIEISPVFSENPLAEISLAMRLGDLSLDPRFSTPCGQIQNREALNAILAGKFREKSTDEWIAQLEPQGVFCARVNTFRDAMSDPQLRCNGMIVELGGDARIRTLGTPQRLHGTPPAYTRFPPRLGEHSTELAREAGFSEPEIRDMIGRGILGTAEPSHAPEAKAQTT